MSRRQQWKRWQPGGQDPWQHNRDVRARKNYRQLVRQTNEIVRILHRINAEVRRFAAEFTAHLQQKADS